MPIWSLLDRILQNQADKKAIEAEKVAKEAAKEAAQQSTPPCTERQKNVNFVRPTDALIQDLDNRDPVIRKESAVALMNQNTEASVDPFIHVLNEGHSDIRYIAARALGNLKSEKAADSLIRALHDNDINLRSDAIGALGKIRGENAIEFLLPALQDESDVVRHFAVNTLAELRKSEKLEKAADYLIQQLTHEDQNIRCESSDALRTWAYHKTIPEKVVDPLIHALNDVDPTVRTNAAVALGFIGSKKSINPLKQVRNDNNVSVRNAAKESLSKIKGDKWFF